MKIEEANKISKIVKQIDDIKELLSDMRGQSENGRVDFVLYSPNHNINIFSDKAKKLRKIAITMFEEDLSEKFEELKQQ